MDTDSKNHPFLDLVWHYKYYFVAHIFIISCVTFIMLYIIGMVPDELKFLNPQAESYIVQGSTSTTSLTSTIPTTTPSATSSVQPTISTLPVRIIINKIGVDASVINPSSTKNSVLNDALSKGAVRYPGSGVLGNGNMFLFGHSTGIRIVNNQAYKTFNHLNQLAIGDIIRVQSVDREYTYSVTSVSLVNSDEELVSFSQKKNMLTLSTCNVFGQKEERFVVEALFIKSTLRN